MKNTKDVYKIDSRRAAEFLWNETGGRIFTAYFRKVDGSMREMNCRRYVRKYLRGGELPYDAKKKNKLPVYDMKRGDYRLITLDGLVSFNICGDMFIVV